MKISDIRTDIILIAALWTFVLIGGGGVPAVASETAVIVIAFVIAACIFPRSEFRLSRGDVLLCALLPCLAMSQLVPLPAEAWRALPGREAIAALYDAADARVMARPLSLSPLATLWSLLGFAPPILAFALTRGSAPEHDHRILGSIAILGCLSAVLGAAQFLLGEGLFIHPRSIAAGPSGLFANQNTQALFCAIALSALLALPRSVRQSWSFAAGLIRPLFAALLLVGGLLTGSRAGMALLAIALAAGLSRPILARLREGRLAPARMAIGSVVLAAMLVVATQLPPVARIISRYSGLHDGRIDTIWPDALALAGQTWPAGIGLGAFKLAFPLIERLDVVDPYFANRAHSDWLEFVIEGGVGAVLVLGIAIGVVIARWRRDGFATGPVATWAATCLTLVSLHSLVDYPLRAIGLSAVAAVAFALIMPRARQGVPA